MTKFKIHRANGAGTTTVEIVEASDWLQLFYGHQYAGVGPIIKVEIVGSADKAIDPQTGEAL